MSARLHVSVTAGYQNIGDAFIRREAFGWVRPLGGAEVYLADSPDVWATQVGVSPADVPHRRRLRWLWSAASRPRSVVVFEPGEVRMDLRALPRELAFVAAVVAVRLRGGVVVLPPRALVGAHRVTLAVHRWSCRLASFAYWRDPVSLAAARAGRVLPDVAFGAEAQVPRGDRDASTLVVSLRGGRPEPDATWSAALGAWASSRGLDVVTLAQVREDEERATKLAERLGGTHVPWSADPVEHERRVREAYGRAHTVVSDRLHVLILAALEGAVPAEVVPGPTTKVALHFREIGVEGVSMDSAGASVEQIHAFLDARAAAADAVPPALDAARRRLDDARSEVVLAIRRAAG